MKFDHRAASASLCSFSFLLFLCYLAVVPLVLCSCKREERGFRVEPPAANAIQSVQTSELTPGPRTNEIATNLSLTVTNVTTNSVTTNAVSTNVAPPVVANTGATNATNASVTNAPATNAPAATNSNSTNAPSTNAASTNAAATNILPTNVVSTNALPTSTNVSNAHVKNEYEENAFALSQGQQLYEYFNCVGCHAHGGGGIGPPLMDDKWIYGYHPEQIFATIVEGRPNGMPSFRGRIPDYQVWQIAAYVRSMSGLVAKDAAPSREDHMKGKPPENSTPTSNPKSTSDTP